MTPDFYKPLTTISGKAVALGMKTILFYFMLAIGLSVFADGSDEVALSEDERGKLKLPLSTELTMAAKTDVEYVKKLKPATIAAIEKSFEPTGKKVLVVAARPVGDYLLLWTAFEGEIDGGVDMIWSVEEKKSVGTFLGGYRG